MFAMGYAPKDAIAYIAFALGKSVYEYKNVPESLFHAILNAPSIGHALNRTLKADPRRFPYRRLTPDEMAFVEFVDQL